MESFTVKILNITPVSIGLENANRLTRVTVREQEEVAGYIRTSQLAIKQNLDTLEQEVDNLNTAYS